LLGLLHARLAIHKIPAGAQVISTFLPLGPTGSGAYGILHLASAVRKLGSNESSGSAGLVSGGLTADEGRTMGLAVYAASMPIGLAIWGFGAIWAAIAVLSVIHRVRHEGSIEFSLGAWAYVRHSTRCCRVPVIGSLTTRTFPAASCCFFRLTFPLGVFATSTTLLGHQLESAAFDILGTVFSGIVFVNWLLVSGLTIINALRGKLCVDQCKSCPGCARDPADLSFSAPA
jgi:tellurite resistance protein TehA-like permease